MEFSSNWRRRRSRQVYTQAVFQAHLIGEAAQYRGERAVLLRRPATLSPSAQWVFSEFKQSEEGFNEFFFL